MANARNNAKSAIAKAQAAKANAKAPAKAPAEKPAEKAPANAAPDAVTDINTLKGMLAEVSKGKHKGKTVKIFFASVRKNVLLCEDGDGENVWVKPDNLKVSGKMTDADIKRLTAKQEADAHETVYVEANALSETDNGVMLKAPGWFKRVFFTKPNDEREGMISTTGAVGPSGMDIFEVVAWKIRKECGMDSYNAIKAKQAELAAIVEAK